MVENLMSSIGKASILSSYQERYKSTFSKHTLPISRSHDDLFK